MDEVDAQFYSQDFRSLTDRECADHIIIGSLFDRDPSDPDTSIGTVREAIQHLERLTPEALFLIDWNRSMQTSADVWCGSGFDHRSLLTRGTSYIRRLLADGIRPNYYLNPPQSIRERQRREKAQGREVNGMTSSEDVDGN